MNKNPKSANQKAGQQSEQKKSDSFTSQNGMNSSNCR